MRTFYVYEHWRPDKDVCFWVGKGTGNRAYRFRRNFHYDNIVKKLASLGMCVEVRMVRSGLGEPEALAIEVERIAFWRSAGVALANYTSGGDGVTGHRHTDETRERIRAKRNTQRIAHSPETRAKIGAANAVALLGRKNPEHSARMRGRKLTTEHRRKISEGNKGRQHSPQTREKMRASNIGKKRSAATRAKLSLSHSGNRPSDATRAKMSATQTKRWAQRRAEVD